MMNTGEQPRDSEHLLSTIAWQIGERVDYALEGSVFVGGAAVQWLRDGLQIVENAGRDGIPGGGSVRRTTGSILCRP